MFFFWIIPIANALLALIHYTSSNKAFLLTDFVWETFIIMINPYLIGAIWLILYALWKGSIKAKGQVMSLEKGNQSPLAGIIDFEKVNPENYMKTVFLAWSLQLAFLITKII
ncbi:hypothetical protein [uncultured Pontibacter sp.]|uniref:hypothetical protein n=1 Tax=uncultured Pontibacter sp. TaxID=453356 RepID=UPI00262BA5CF|nr:hypothetical protein [uncultured Pontibacter sp.]